MGDLELPMPLDLVFRHFWLIAIVFASIQYLAGTWRIKRSTESGSDLRRGCQRVVYIYVFAAGFPWLVVGIGTLRGDISSTLELFDISLHNPITVFFWGYGVAINLLFALWVFLANGAAFLSEHSVGLGLASRKPPKIWQIRLFAAIGVLALVLVIVILSSGVVPDFGESYNAS